MHDVLCRAIFGTSSLLTSEASHTAKLWVGDNLMVRRAFKTPDVVRNSVAMDLFAFSFNVCRCRRRNGPPRPRDPSINKSSICLCNSSRSNKLSVYIVCGGPGGGLTALDTKWLGPKWLRARVIRRGRFRHYINCNGYWKRMS